MRRGASMKNTNGGMKYSFGLSFPGKIRGDDSEWINLRYTVEHVAERMSTHCGSKSRVLYDRYHQGIFARPKLSEYLPKEYQKCNLIVVFLCKEYSRSEWCLKEWRIIRDLTYDQEQRHRVMYLWHGKRNDRVLRKLGLDWDEDGFMAIDKLNPMQIWERVLARYEHNHKESPLPSLASNDPAPVAASIGLPSGKPRCSAIIKLPIQRLAIFLNFHLLAYLITILNREELHPLSRRLQKAMAVRLGVSAKSHIEVIASDGKTPSKKLYMIDPLRLPGILGIPLDEINVIDSSSLRNFDPRQHDQYKAHFVTPTDFFLPEVFYSRTAGLLPGSWLNEKTESLGALTILLPFQSFIQDYFSSDYLEKNVTVEPDIQESSPAIKISLKVDLTGINGKQPYIITKVFPLKNENELSDDYPTLAVWPNLPSTFRGSWREYFLLESVSDENGDHYSFRIQNPTGDARDTIRSFRQEEYVYWQCTQFPDILKAINHDSEYLGVIPLKSNKSNQGGKDNWIVGVDFGTSFTNIYINKGGTAAQRIELKPNLLKVTLGLEAVYRELHDHIYRDFFIPDVLNPKGHLLPMPMFLTTIGWQGKTYAIAKIITEARIYFPRYYANFSQEVITNVKWKHIKCQQPFLAQLARMISVEAAIENVRTVEWAVSYPSAFSQQDLNFYQDTWRRILEDLSRISGQIHSLSPEGLQTESIAFAQYFADVLNKPLVHATCVDVGGGTSDLSIWSDQKLVHQASVPYAGYDIFHNLLRNNLEYAGEIFALSPEEATDFQQTLEYERFNFHSRIDIWLRRDEENSEGAKGDQDSLINLYRINSQQERNRQFRSLLAFAYCGLFHYTGLIQKWLREDGLITEDYFSSLYLGGNGSRFIHWLSPTGRWQRSSEVNDLVAGIMLAASELKRNPDLLTLSKEPKHEVCGGLVVPPGGTRLTGIDRKTVDNPFLGESCVINGKPFEAHDRLTLDEEWSEIKDFTITSTAELETYLKNFNKIIKEFKIDEIEPLRDYKTGNLLEITEDLRRLLLVNLTHQCLYKRGPRAEFVTDPPFFMTLKAFLRILAIEWSRLVSPRVV